MDAEVPKPDQKFCLWAGFFVKYYLEIDFPKKICLVPPLTTAWQQITLDSLHKYFLVLQAPRTNMYSQ